MDESEFVGVPSWVSTDPFRPP